MKHNGVLYFGADKTCYIFHKYFEDIDFKQTQKDLFQDAEIDDDQEKSEADHGEWMSLQDFRLEISKKGVLNFIYTDHKIKIYPLRSDLFEEKISQITCSI